MDINGRKLLMDINVGSPFRVSALPGGALYLFLNQCSVLRFFKAKDTRIIEKSKQVCEVTED
jgi:hypothetical protein